MSCAHGSQAWQKDTLSRSVFLAFVCPSARRASILLLQASHDDFTLPIAPVALWCPVQPQDTRRGARCPSRVNLPVVCPSTLTNASNKCFLPFTLPVYHKLLLDRVVRFNSSKYQGKNSQISICTRKTGFPCKSAHGQNHREREATILLV